MVTDTHVSRAGQVARGVIFLAFATVATAVSMSINYRYGMSSAAHGDEYVCATIFLTADAAKVGLLIGLGAGGWTRGMRLIMWSVWAVCMLTSLWAAANNFCNQTAHELSRVAAVAENEREGAADAAAMRAELDRVRTQIGAIAEQADVATLELLKNRADEKAAAERGISERAGVDCSGRNGRQDCAKAESALTRIIERLGEARRREELGDRERALTAQLTSMRQDRRRNPRTEANTSSIYGLSDIAATWTGHDVRDVGMAFGIIRVVLFICLMEGLIFLAEPGIMLVTGVHNKVTAPKLPHTPDATFMTAEEARDIRLALDLTQVGMHARTGIPLSTLRKYEQGRLTIGLDAACTIRAASAERLPGAGVVQPIRRAKR